MKTERGLGGGSVKVVRCYAGRDGESHFEELEVPIHEIATGRSSELLPVTAMAFWETPSAYSQDWHPAGRAQWVLVLSGVMEIECFDGSSVALSPGDVFLADDTTGRGHLSRCPGPCRAALVPMAPDFDPTVYRVPSAAEAN